MIPIVSTAWEDSHPILATPGRAFSVFASVQTPGSYWLILLDAATVPDDASDVTAGAHGKVLAIIPVTTTVTGQTVGRDYTLGGNPSDSGVRCLVGCVALLSTTAPTSTTKATAGAWFNGSVG